MVRKRIWAQKETGVSPPQAASRTLGPGDFSPLAAGGGGALLGHWATAAPLRRRGSGWPQELSGRWAARGRGYANAARPGALSTTGRDGGDRGEVS